MVCVSGSGGTGETPSQLSRNFWQNAPARERQSRLPVPRTLRGPLEPVLGAFLPMNELTEFGD